MNDQTIWLKSDGKWTLASYVMREICQTDEVTAIEAYFILSELEIKNIFRDYWRNFKFYNRIGIDIHSTNSNFDLNILLKNGNTEKTKCLCNQIPRSASFVNAAASKLDLYLKEGDEKQLDEMIYAGSPFGVAKADAMILAAALELKEKDIIKMPEHRLVLMRRFEKMGRYPMHRIYPKPNFLEPYLEAIRQNDTKIEPGDVVALMLDIPWHKTKYYIEDSWSMPGKSFGKSEIDDNSDWLEIVLKDFAPIFNRNNYTTRDQAIDGVYQAYQFLRERFNAIRSSYKWFNESKLFNAIEVLFGKREVRRHARPGWLTPQHLDIYLPRYNLAVEYMGAHHYEPIEAFGGIPSLKERKAKDERKRLLCGRMGLKLIYVTYKENIGQRAREIYESYGTLEQKKNERR